MSRTVDRIFGHGDEVRRAMVGVDWAATPLGPSAGWPDALRSVLRLVFSSRFSMWMGWGPELTFFYNEAYRRDTLRAKHPWALGRPASEVWAEIWDEVGPRIASVLATGEATWDAGLLLFLERSGYPEETYHTFSYSPLADENGATGGVLCVVTEDTERVLAERRMATLRDLGAAVTATQTHAEVLAAMQRTLLGNRWDVPFGLVYLLEHDGSARLAAAIGVEPGPVTPEVLAADATDPWPVSALPATGVVLVEGLIGPVVQSAGAAWPQPPQAAAVVPLTTPGERRPRGFLAVGLNPYRRFDDGYRGFVELLAGQLTSGLVNAESHEAQRQRAESLAELDRAKTAFFSNISHEFRTPLTLIMGPVTDLLDAERVDPDELRATLDLVHRNGLRLGRLVNSLLDFARVEAGQAKAELAPVDLAALTADLAGMFRAATERAGLRLEVDCPPLPQPVWVDRDMWEKVVLNLLSNAVKFTLEGGVTVRVRPDGDDVVTEVADTGTGIPAAELDTLFERFHQVKGQKARSGEGSGIGLALARELVRLHGGSIAVASEPGRGSTFTVRIPTGQAATATAVAPTAVDGSDPQVAEAYIAEAMRWVPEAPDVVPGSMPPRAAAESPTAAHAGARGRILVADDNPDMLDYLRRLLSPRWDVEMVTDGAAALTAARREPPDLIVSDVMMPERDGISLVAALRSDPTTAQVPVLLLSARAGTEAAVGGMEAGADDYLVKPFSTSELLARVDGHLRLGRARRDAERRFRALADATPAMIWVDDRDGVREFGNRAWQRFTGLVHEDAGRTWRDHIHPADRERYDTERAQAEAETAPFTIEYRLCTRDGGYRWVNDTGAPVGGGYVGGCLDIDARHRERERQRLLATLGAALDRETEPAERRSVLLRTIVDGGLAEAARIDPTHGHGHPSGFGADAPAPDADVVERALAERGPVVVPGGPRTTVVVPLVARGHAVGLLSVVRSSPPDDDDVDLLAEVARRSATALDNAALLEQERDAARRLDLLQRATAALAAAADPTAVARVAADYCRSLGADPVVVAQRVGDHLEALTPADTADVPHAVRRAALTGEPVWEGAGIEVALPLLLGDAAVGAIGMGFPDGTPGLTKEGRAAVLTVAGQVAQALDRARLHQIEHEVADVLQRSLLPGELPRLARLDTAARYVPGTVDTQAGGDWYELLPLDGDRVAIVVGDVVGHGPPAAAVMGKLSAALSAYLLEGHPPAAALEQLDRVAFRTPGARGSTCVCLILDWSTGELRWARAGHLPVLLLDGDGGRFLDDGGGTVLGVRGRPPYREAATTMAPGGVVLAYTDGLVERRDEVVDVGLERLLGVAALAAGRPAEDVADVVIAGASAGSPSDDVALVVVRRVAAPLTLRHPAVPGVLHRMRDEVEAWAHDCGFRRELIDDLQLSVNEAVSNAVEHAYPPDPRGDVVVELARTGDGAVAARVRDFGQWRPPAADQGYRGRGLGMIRTLAQDVTIERDNGTEVAFRVVASRAHGADPTPLAAGSTGFRPAVPFVVDLAGRDGVLSGHGDLDREGADVLRPTLLAALYRQTRVELDLRGVGFLGSAGVGLLVEAAAVAAAGDVSLSVRVAARSAAARVLALTETDAVLAVEVGG